MRSLNWEDNGYDRFKLVVFNTPGDGSCLLHAIASSISRSYRSGILNCCKYTTTQLVLMFRSNIGTYLTSTDANNKLNYDTICNGELREMGKSNPEWSLKGILSLLQSNRYLSDDMIIIIEYILQTNVFVLDSTTKDVYMRNMNDYDTSIVIHYVPGHFESFSLITSTGERQSYFTNNHPFIVHLRDRIDKIKSQNIPLM